MKRITSKSNPILVMFHVAPLLFIFYYIWKIKITKLWPAQRVLLEVRKERKLKFV